VDSINHDSSSPHRVYPFVNILSSAELQILPHFGCSKHEFGRPKHDFLRLTQQARYSWVQAIEKPGAPEAPSTRSTKHQKHQAQKH
jgi:hypothetical protein